MFGGAADQRFAAFGLRLSAEKGIPGAGLLSSARFCRNWLRHAPCSTAVRMKRRPERLHWNDRTPLRLVQFDYEEQAAPRAVRLTGAAARVGDMVRVCVSGVEVEGHITAIEGSILRIDLSPDVPANARVIDRSPSESEKRDAKKRMAKASPRATGRNRQAG